ncbi:uncharacterized protein LOC141667978 isoform X2 [Apium graveolens]|uniref:uncharacterized protein LOC141667978 isoform X2 n=1 Tax=Apium graveolens TaxID=4045 RepID=UPI003D7BDEAE
MSSPSLLVVDPKTQQPHHQFQENQEPTQRFQENLEQNPQIDPSHSLNVSSQDFQNPLQSHQNNDTQQVMGPENPPEIADAASEPLGEGQVQVQHQQQQNVGFQGLNPAAAAAVAALSQLTQFAGNMGDVERAMVELRGLIAAGGLGALMGGGGAAPFIGQGPMHYAPISQPPYRGGGRRGADRYRRGGRGNFGNRGRGRWTPRENLQQISSSGPANVAAETTKSVEEVAEASTVSIDQAGQLEMPYQASVQTNVTSAPQRHMQVARCEICRVDCNSFEILEQHKGGKKHKKNMQKLEVLKAYQSVANAPINGKNDDSNTEGKLEPENLQNFEGNYQTIPENFHSEALPVQINLENQPQNPEIHQLDNQRPGMKRKMRGGRGGGKLPSTQRWPKEPKVAVPLICDLCNVMCNTQEVLDRHLSGKKHTSKYKRFEGHQAMYGPAELQVLYPPNPISQTLSQPQGHQQNFSFPQGLNLLSPVSHATPQIHPVGASGQASNVNPDYQQNFSAPQGSNLLPPGAPTGPQISQVHQQ